MRINGEDIEYLEYEADHASYIKGGQRRKEIRKLGSTLRFPIVCGSVVKQNLCKVIMDRSKTLVSITKRGLRNASFSLDTRKYCFCFGNDGCDRGKTDGTVLLEK